MGRKYSNEFKASRWAMLWCETCQEDMVFKFKAKYYPKKRKCPKCGGIAEKRYDESIAYVQKDESQLRRKIQKISHEGLAKPEADQLLTGLIDGTKRRLENVGGAAHYTPVVPDMDYMLKTGQAKPLTEKQASERNAVLHDAMKKVTKDGKKVNPKRSNNRQTL